MSVLTVTYGQTDAPAQFCQSLRETGFAVLRNHPIPMNLIQKAYDAWGQFFLSELSSKQVYVYDRNTQDGYFPFRSENAKDAKISDLKEFFHFYPWGKVPEYLRSLSFSIFEELQSLAAELLEWVERFLPEPIANKLSMPLKNMIVDSPNTLLRILHYPPLTGEFEEGAVRAHAHEDINLITLLPAATAPGLEVLDVNGKWHGVACDPGSIVVNVGDMLQMCTQHYYKSTTHRVVNPADEGKYKSRYSMPLFLHARKEVMVSDTLTANEYLHQRLREIGIY